MSRQVHFLNPCGRNSHVEVMQALAGSCLRLDLDASSAPALPCALPHSVMSVSRSIPHPAQSFGNHY